jgi:hypothetical protein
VLSRELNPKERRWVREQVRPGGELHALDLELRRAVLETRWQLNRLERLAGLRVSLPPLWAVAVPRERLRLGGWLRSAAAAVSVRVRAELELRAEEPNLINLI